MKSPAKRRAFFVVVTLVHAKTGVSSVAAKVMTHCLFVYGTLAPGKPNAHVLANVPGSWEPATVNGRLYQEGWGAAAGYPGIVLDEQGDEVHGLVFTSSELPAHWLRLDEFEGEGYARVLMSARLRDGARVDAYIYQLSGRNEPRS